MKSTSTNKSKVSLKALLAKCKKKRILLLAHENADLDAVCSAAMFQGFLKKNKINSQIGVPRHLNERAQHFCLSNKVSFLLNPELTEFDLVFLFDFNSPEQLGWLKKKFAGGLKCNCFEAFAFDHHVAEKDSLLKGKDALLDDSCVSTTQLLSALLAKHMSPRMHFFNCIGIIEDTGHFVVGDELAFTSFASSLSLSGKKYADVLEFSRIIVPADERTAFLKAAQRAQIQQINGAIVVTSTVSFYQGHAASKLLDFGAHIAIVAGEEKDGLTTLSARAESEFKEQRNFNLMKQLMMPLKEKLGGDCGGHSGAAQWKGKVAPEVALRAALDILKKSI